MSPTKKALGLSVAVLCGTLAHATQLALPDLAAADIGRAPLDNSMTCACPGVASTTVVTQTSTAYTTISVVVPGTTPPSATLETATPPTTSGLPLPTSELHGGESSLPAGPGTPSAQSAGSITSGLSPSSTLPVVVSPSESSPAGTTVSGTSTSTSTRTSTATPPASGAMGGMRVAPWTMVVAAAVAVAAAVSSMG